MLTHPLLGLDNLALAPPAKMNRFQPDMIGDQRVKGGEKDFIALAMRLFRRRFA
jgi:hypothetical protein